MINDHKAGLILSEMVQTSRIFRMAGQHNKEQGFTGTKFGFLQYLRHRDVRLGELATQLFVSAPVASRAVDCLETDGLVERGTDPEDARAHLISITEKGRTQLADSEHLVVRQFAEALTDWSLNDAVEVISLLHRLNGHLSEVTWASEHHESKRADTLKITPETGSEMIG